LGQFGSVSTHYVYIICKKLKILQPKLGSSRIICRKHKLLEYTMKTENLGRGQFLKQLGLNSAALMAFYCMGSTLSSCSSKDADPAPANNNNGSNTNTPTKFELILDLTSNDFKALKNEGEFVIKDTLIIANAKGSIIALSKACTHQGTTLEYRKATNDLHCSNHGSNFTTLGAVANGPAGSALKVYKTELIENGNKLKITE
jgi:cytochrome b6-f complex iron-sulfur subunit